MTTNNPYKPKPKRYILKGTPESPVVTLRGDNPTGPRLMVWLPLPLLAFGLFAGTVAFVQWRTPGSVEEESLYILGSMLLLSVPPITLGLLNLKRPQHKLVVDRNQRSITVNRYGKLSGEISADDLGKYGHRKVRVSWSGYGGGSVRPSAPTRHSREHVYLTAKHRDDVLLYRVAGARDLKCFIGTLEYLAGKCDEHGNPIETEASGTQTA